MSEEIVVLNTEEIEALSTDVIQGADALVIRGEDDLKLASFILGGIKDLLAEAERLFRPNINRWHLGHRAALEEMNQFIGPLVATQRKVKVMVSDHHNEIRLAAERARRKAEAEARAREEEQRLAAAVQLEDAGHEEAADALLEAPPAPIAKPMISTPPPPKVAGMTASPKYTAEVVDKDALLAWVLATRSFDLVKIDQTILNAYARAGKEEFDIPGCKLIVGTQVASRRRS